MSLLPPLSVTNQHICISLSGKGCGKTSQCVKTYQTRWIYCSLIIPSLKCRGFLSKKEQTHLKSLLGPDFLHLFKWCFLSSVQNYLWHELTKTSLQPEEAQGVASTKTKRKSDSKRDSAAFFAWVYLLSSLAARRGERESERKRMQRNRSQVSLCLSMYPLMRTVLPPTPTPPPPEVDVAL